MAKYKRKRKERLMKKEDAKMPEKVFDTETIGYAYLYPVNGGQGRRV